MATHSSILAWRIPLTEEPGYNLHGYSLWGPQRVRYDLATNTHTGKIPHAEEQPGPCTTTIEPGL